MRSSRGVRVCAFFSSTSTPSSARRASSSSVNSLTIGGLRFHAGKESHAFGHFLFPCIGRCDRRQPSALLLEFHGPPRQVTRLFGRELHLLGRNDGLHLLQAFFAHRLGKDGIGLA